MKALLIVDVQYDFLPGGSLAVPQGNEILKPILEMQKKFEKIFYTQDWHPKNHCSFKVNGGIWPEHCVQNTHGSEIHQDIKSKGVVVQKGTHSEIDSYSGFWDNERKNKTHLDNLLREANIDHLYVCGLATDYCVKFTALDAIDAGYKVTLIENACRGVNVQPEDSLRALDSMKKVGVEIVNSKNLFDN